MCAAALGEREYNPEGFYVAAELTSLILGSGPDRSSVMAYKAIQTSSDLMFNCT